MALDMLGTLSYGDPASDLGVYAFNNNVRLKEYSVTPVPDPSNRTTSYSLIQFTVEWIVNLADAEGDAESIDDLIDDIRQQLGVRAGVLAFEDTGLGTLNINGDGDPRDVKYGPVPGAFVAEPLGGGNAAKLTWSLSTATVLCADGITVDDGQNPMELTYRMTRQVDESGYTTRTIAFRVAIPATRTSPTDRFPLTTPDEYLEALCPDPLPGFRRTYGPVEIDESGTVMTFSVQDEEMPPQAYPAGVIKPKFRHRVKMGSIGGKPNMFSWIATFSGEFEMARDQPLGSAWNVFFALVKQRLKIVKDNFKPFLEKKGAKTETKGFIMPLDLEITDDIYSRGVAEFSFSCSFQCGPDNLLAGSALFTLVDGTWDDWAASLQATALNPRGDAGLTDSAGDRAIVDLCVASGTPVLSTGATPLASVAADDLKQMFGDLPKPADSWIMYENAIVAEDGQNVMTTAPLPDDDLQDDGEDDEFGSDDDPDPYDPSPYSNEPDSDVQARAGGQYVFYLEGKALRYGYPISPPQISSIAGVPVTPANTLDTNCGFRTWLHTNLIHPVYAANWRLRYVGSKAPDKSVVAINTPTNDGGGADIDDDGDLTTDDSPDDTTGGDPLF